MIGGVDNTRSMVRDGGQAKVMEEAVTVNILNAYDAKPFWISWANNLIEVGEGNVRGKNRYSMFVNGIIYVLHED